MLQKTYACILFHTLILALIFGHVDSAWTKVINSSSVHDGPYEAQNAIDGNLRRDPEYCGCCAATASELNPWYELDFGVNRSVHRIHVEGRTNTPNHSQHFKGMQIYTKSVHANFAVGEETLITEATYNVDYVLPVPKSTRYVTLVLYNVTRVFTICELTVYGDCTEGTFGGYCESICHCEGDPCNTPDGECPSGECLPGYNGTACDKVCSGGTYGAGCTDVCGNCIGSDICNKQDGRCPGQCASGYQGDTCKQKCFDGFYGPGCTAQCGSCYNGVPCDKVTGHCGNGCAAGYKTDFMCSTECSPGTFGVGCNGQCGNCKGGSTVCAKTDGSCQTGCAAGYKGDICKTVCDDGTYGENCNSNCGNCLNGATCNKKTGVCYGGCSTGYIGDLCVDECPPGLYGNACSNTCGNCTTDTTCHHIDGTCIGGCKAGFKAPRCNYCDDGLYGPSCTDQCGHCLNGDPCNGVNGHCEYGCAAGFQQHSLCNTECSPGSYGNGCNNTCGNCTAGTTCHHIDGTCIGGCIVGFKAPLCNDCDEGLYGPSCTDACGYCLNGVPCNRVTGHCGNGCADGYQTDPLCNTECPPGSYGSVCRNECGNCVTNTTCHHIHGECFEGCKAGFKTPMCQEECNNGTFGPGCKDECGSCSGNNTCDKVNGTCRGCQEGFTGHDCKQSTLRAPSKQSGGSPAAAIGGAVGGVAVISAVVIVIVIILRRRRTNANASRRQTDKHLGRGTKSGTTDKPSSSKYKEPNSNYKTHTEPTIQRNKDDDMYVGFLTRATDLKPCQLWDYIWQKKKEGNLLFYQEFNRLASGLQHPREVALKGENKPLTRYRALCAYDHSRVPLDTADGGNGYINASFINGIDKPRKFIASQGPTIAMRNDFWRMIWQYNSCKIVMLTNLFEMGTEKCLIYWPEEESKDVTYGNIAVSLVSKHVTTDYDIRNLKIRQNSIPTRNVTQYHFKAWPDKDVPDSTWPLVEFWRTVMEDTVCDTGPIVVHCSAGIGRTGTFIAMDNAYHQAKGTGNITMLDLVKTLRDQRVNMVQTKDQYVFLHEAVADAVLFGTHIIWSRDFENIYSFLTQMEHDRKTSRMQEQYNLIVESVEDRKKLEQKKDGAATADIYSNIFINNISNETVVSIDEYIPKSKSMVHVREHGAVLLPNYEGKDAFIVCRSPTEASFAGFWSIIAEQNIKTIIMMTETTSKNYKKCKEIGASERSVQSSFGVKVLEESMTDMYCKTRFTFDSNNCPKAVSQFEFKNWPIGAMAPNKSRSMLDFLEIVLRWQQRLTSTQPILVHCSTGFERSGLVCVLLNELERMKREQGHINILQTVKLMLERNEHIIPNFEQYKYVYDTILETFHKDTSIEEETIPEDSVYENCQQ